MVIPVEHFISMSFKYDAPFNIETYEKKEEKKKKIDKITCMCYPYEVINQQMFKNFLNIREFSFFFFVQIIVPANIHFRFFQIQFSIGNCEINEKKKTLIVNLNFPLLWLSVILCYLFFVVVLSTIDRIVGEKYPTRTAIKICSSKCVSTNGSRWKCLRKKQGKKHEMKNCHQAHNLL